MLYKDCELKKTYTVGCKKRIEIWLDGVRIGQAPTWSKAKDKVDAYWNETLTTLKAEKVI